MTKLDCTVTTCVHKYEQIWGNLIAVDDNAIMVYINRLRSKIEDNARTPQHIITIRGVGYRFVP